MEKVISKKEPIDVSKPDTSSRAEWAILKELRVLTDLVEKLGEKVSEISNELSEIKQHLKK